MASKVVKFETVYSDSTNKKGSEVFEKVKKEAKYMAWNVGNWFYNKENIGFVVGATGVVLPAVAGVMRAVNNGKAVHDAKKMKELKKLNYYDRSAGHYWSLRRPLTNAEWATVAERKKNGETVGDILESLKVLK